MYISRNCNTIFEFMTGDGFRSLALPKLITSDSLVIAPKMMIKQYYESKYINAVSFHSVNKVVEGNHHKKIKVIIIDSMLPRVESRAHKAMMKLCKGKQIAFIQLPHDLRSLVSAMELMSVTKNCKLRSVIFSRFLFNRGRW